MTTTIFLAVLLTLGQIPDAPVGSVAGDGAPAAVTANPQSSPLANAEALLQNGQALPATAHLMRDLKVGADVDPAQAALLLARAAEVLADAGDVKAAAVAADAAWSLDGKVRRPRASLLVTRYALALRESDPAGARALAERAVLQDGDNVEAAALAGSLAGSDTWTLGHLTVAGGLGLGIASLSSFVVGFGIEREIRGSVHETADVDGLLVQRGVAAGVAWPTAVGAVVASGVGLALIMAHHPGEEPVLPGAFAPLPAPPTAPPTPAGTEAAP